MLSVKDLNVCYGAIHAIHDVSLEVHDGEIVSLIGANGAGKTTILHTITGLKKAKSGSVTYNDADLLKTDPSKIITLGVAHVPEGRHIFPGMTVEENLEMGAYIRKDDLSASIKDVYERFPRLKERRRQLAGTLSGGEQQMLAVGRALMSRPSILLMDEPSMGLSPLLVKEIFKIIQEVHKQGMTVLLVEQNAKMALSISDRAYVLETGRISMSGAASDLLNDEKVKKAYPDKDVWCYTGYLFDRDVLGDMCKKSEITKELLTYIDILVDGEFVAEQKNLKINFRGSDNQRIIDVKKSLETGEVVHWDGEKI